MADFTIKQNDTRPQMVRRLRQTIDGTETAINLTTASSVTLYMKATAGGVITRTASINDPTNGEVTVRFVASDTAVVGQYNAEFEIGWADAGVETVPNAGYFSIEVVDDIGP